MHNKNAPWQSYWKDTSFDTFGARFSEGNPIADVLARKLSSVSLQNCHPTSILDLGCGKGDHFQWLKDVMRHDRTENIEITGVDAALPNTSLDAHTRIITDNFEALVNVKRAALEFDAAFALYAAEYGDFCKLLKALKAVAIKPLDCVFMMHTPDSVITTKTKHTLSFYQLLLDKSTDSALRALKKSHDIKKFEMHALAKINSIVQLKQPELMHDLQLVVQRLQKLFSAVDLQYKDEHARGIVTYFDQLKMHVLRLEQQLKAAKNSATLLTELQNQSYEVSVDERLNNEFGEIGRLIHFVLVP